MVVLFWFCIALIAYAYIGYGMYLWVRAAIMPRPIAKGAITPSISIVIAVRNEERNLPAKLRNLAEVRYPREQIQIVIVSDGSTDGTRRILEDNAVAVEAIILETNGGKASALNQAVKRATGDILVFQDARQYLEPEAISELASCFADPTVGAVSGELLLANSTEDSASEGLGIYWKIEKLVRRLESATGSVVGVTGAIYAMRRECFVELPPGTILDDVLLPMQVARKEMRVIFEPAARAHDRIFSDPKTEFLRKVRTLTGNYQLLQLSPWLFSPSNPLLLRFVSHKLLRLLVPFLLLLALVSCVLIHSRFYQAIFWVQCGFYGLAMLGIMAPALKNFRLVTIPRTFVVLNWAAVVAFYNFATGNTEVWN